MNIPSLILASASPRRAELLRQLQSEFRVLPSSAPEEHSEQFTAMELCRVNAYRKARSVAKQHPDALVLGADTLVYREARLFGKPGTMEEAEEMLGALQGRTHQVVSGVCLIHLRERRQRVFAVATDVTFRPLTTRQIRGYLESIQPFDKAGAYAIQENGEWIVESISGSYSNVVGLPLERLREELERW